PTYSLPVSRRTYSRCGLHTRAVTKVVTAIRGLQTFRHLHACPGCFRLERLPGGARTHWENAAFHGARGKPTFGRPRRTALHSRVIVAPWRRGTALRARSCGRDRPSPNQSGP